MRWLPSCSVLSWQRVSELWSLSLLMRILISHQEGLILMSYSQPSYFPKAPPPYNNTLGLRASTYDFGDNIDPKSIKIRKTIRKETKNSS